MNIKKLADDFLAAFGDAATLPIAFWHSDMPVAHPQPISGCFFPAFAKVRDGEAVSFDSATMKCGGGKFYCGLATMPEYLSTFVSEKEHYKATPRLVEDFVGTLCIKMSESKYINFRRIEHLEENVDYHGVLIYATPDILSGLVAWACYDNAADDAVCIRWGSGCSATVRAVIKENATQGHRCFIGLFDPSVRRHVRAGELMFAIPKCRLDEMAGFMRDTCLFNGHAWPKVRQRIDDVVDGKDTW